MQSWLDDGALPAMQIAVAGEQTIPQSLPSPAQGPGFDGLGIRSNQDLSDGIGMGENASAGEGDDITLFSCAAIQPDQTLRKHHPRGVIDADFLRNQ